MRRLAVVALAISLTVVACTSSTDPEPTTTASPSSAQPNSNLSEGEATTVTEPPDPLHVASPDWREQIIYFVMIDRFADGDPTNNDQGAGEYDPSDDSRFQGGDLQGIIDELDYIEGLGATSVWITPPVSNQWWDPLVTYGGYHGYWAANFTEVDPHFGDLETYQDLSRSLHEQGMYLIQDIVTNHTGNFFTYIGEGDPDDPTRGYQGNPRTVPVTAPTQSPFDQNDPNDPAHLAADIYHWTTTIQDFTDPEQLTLHQLADLDDLNTENPVVRTALRDAYAYWIENVGVDGFRIDTVRHVEHDFWNEFMHSTDPSSPGMNAVAAGTGREDFLAFGEAFITGEPFDDTADREVASFTGTAETPELPAVIGFPMYTTINRVFGEGAATSELAFRLDTLANSGIYPDPLITPIFLDNHDVGRFLARGTNVGLEQALTFLLTSPGIPVIYYGTEQGFTEQRLAMFAGGQDRYDTQAPLYLLISQLSGLRLSTKALTHGSTRVLASAPGPGVVAFARDYEDSHALILINTASTPALAAKLDTGLEPGTVLKAAFSRTGSTQAEIVDSDGAVTIELPAGEAAILIGSSGSGNVIDGPGVAIDQATIGQVSASIDRLWEQNQPFRQDVTIRGSVEGDGELLLVIDGDLASARPLEVRSNGRWDADLSMGGFVPGLSTHQVTVYSPDSGAAATPLDFTVEVFADGETTVFAEPLDDAVGPTGSYIAPQDSSFGGQMDIGEVSLTTFGTNLEVKMSMAEVTDVWNPANGFDHVMFHVFIDVPGVDGGAEILPNLNAATPSDFSWDVMALAEGWSVGMFAADGASEQNYGGPAGPVPLVTVDKTAGTVALLFDARALGSPETLSGARVYITTWDWDGVQARYRPLTPTGDQWEFGGGSEGDPLVFDDTDVFVIP